MVLNKKHKIKKSPLAKIALVILIALCWIAVTFILAERLANLTSVSPKTNYAASAACTDTVTLVFSTPTPTPMGPTNTPTVTPTKTPTPTPPSATATPTSSVVPTPACGQCAGMYNTPQSFCKLSCPAGQSCQWSRDNCSVNGATNTNCYRQICIGYPPPR